MFVCVPCVYLVPIEFRDDPQELESGMVVSARN